VGIKDEHGYGKVQRPTRKVRRGRFAFVRILFDVPAEGPKGKALKVEVTLTKKGESKPTTSLILHLLIV
uniref:hypothetical protein n=1 Tax=Salmonella sp. s54412 TaxID=3160128 RepID=UPI003754D2CF